MSTVQAILIEPTTPPLALLGAGAVYTGTWRRVREEPNLTGGALAAWLTRDRIRGLAASDVAGTLTIQESNDAVTVNRTVNLIVPAGIGLGLSFDVLLTGQFVRLLYTNGAAPQAAFTFAAWAE